MRPDNDRLQAARKLLVDAVMDLEPIWCNDHLEDPSDDDVRHALENVRNAREQLCFAVADIDRKGRPSTTIFECKCCDSCITCRNDDCDKEFRSKGWKRIQGVDGPHAICPTCHPRWDELKVSFVEDGYEDAYVD